MSTRDSISYNIRVLRVAKGMSQERLALAADIDRSYIGRIERAKENLTIAALEAIAKALEVSVADLVKQPLEGAPPPPSLRAGRKPKTESR
ncbi:helix-turn-helix domain-containing protein [Aureimonas altamirensis]|uniref:helix-turn-helix domain-containing protein n=1 Tax=Aureimonas altamirensis TaxID=370622 RepID=UPI0020375691|nr:helix-turn-helix transcriptional regulator [Aureimonas altamirensis]MCM2505417.1 helix-turn-helix domain-containing protein [Aureimonas altamirensis]